MKLHVDTDAKTVAIEGVLPTSTVFNYLMSWFPEEWEKWKFISNWDSEKYKELIITQEVFRNPYWNPWEVNCYAKAGNDTTEPFANPCFTTSKQTSFNFNHLII